MKVFNNAIIAMIIVMFAGFAAADPIVVQGEELKNLVVTEKGTTWVLPEKTISFLPDGKLYACDILKNGGSNCDSGIFTVTENAVETKFTKAGARTLVIKKDGETLTLNESEVIQYTRIPTLFQPDYSAKNFAAEKWRSKESFKIIFTDRSVGSAVILGGKGSVWYSAYPQKKKVDLWGVYNLCLKGELDSEFWIDEYRGELVLDIASNMPWPKCPDVQYRFDPLTKEGYVLLREEGNPSRWLRTSAQLMLSE